jgi:hypothetical protein
MEKPDILALARAAGLGKALREFRDDVIAAGHAAEHARSGFDEPRDPTTEPWPPMRVFPSPPPSAGTGSEGDKS